MEKILMRSVVGLAAATLLGYLLILIKAPVLFFPIIVLTAILARKKIVTAIKEIKIGFNRKTIVILLVFTLGIAGQVAVIAPSGRIINGDLVFWSSHAHDASWHIALMNEINSGVPFQNPVFSGERLVNYHFFSDIIPALLNRYLGISPLDLYFRITPLVYSILFGASAYFLTKKMTGDFSAAIWSTLFAYFGGSFGYIVTYIKDRTIGGESIFWATQPQSASGNPPQIISNFLVLTFLYFVYSYIKKKNLGSLLASVIILGTLTEFKVYGAIVLLGATLLSGLWQIAIPAGLLAGALYLPNTLGSTSFLIFQPWWFIRTMIVEPSRLDWLDLERRRQTYFVEHNWKRVISIELSGFLIFFFGNLGARFIGLWEFIRSAKTAFKDRFNRLFLLVILISLTLPLVFLQRGVAPNTSQFLQYFVLLFGILAGISTAKLIKAVKYPVVKIAASAFIILIMVPTQAALLYQFYSRPPLAKISAGEIEALNFIRKNTSQDTVILTPPFNQYIKQTGPIPNIWAWSDTGYIAAFSGKREYFADKEQVDIMGYNFKEREGISKLIFESEKPEIVREKITESGATLIYYPKEVKPKVDLATLGLTKFIENSEIEVWKTN